MKSPERSQSVLALLVGLVVVIVLLVTGISTLDRFSQNKAFPAQSGGLPTVIEEATITPVMSGTQTASYVITQKANLLATECRITRTPRDTQIPLPTGTSEDVRVKFTAEKLLGLDALNGWFGLINGYNISLYAGSLLDDPEQGAIVFLIFAPYPNIEEKYLTPTLHGGVRVVAEQNNRLTLLAADGETFYFDVPARRFVASLTEVVPTATPPPTNTPIPPLSCTLMPAPNPYPAPSTPLPSINSYPVPVAPIPNYNTYPMPNGLGTEAP
jgi:hypothetical protein